MPRHSKPEFVVAWEKIAAAGPPRCCHTCDRYLPNGDCAIADSPPPVDFAAAVGVCPDWAALIPF